MRILFFTACVAVIIIVLNLKEEAMDARIRIYGDFEEVEARMDACRLDYKWERKQNIMDVYSEDLAEAVEVLDDIGVNYHIIGKGDKYEKEI